MVWMVSEGFIYVIVTLYFWFIRGDWSYLFIPVISFNIISFGCFILPESPRILLTLGEQAKAITAIQKIAAWNGTKLELGPEGGLHEGLLQQEKAISDTQ